MLRSLAVIVEKSLTEEPRLTETPSHRRGMHAADVAEAVSHCVVRQGPPRFSARYLGTYPRSGGWVGIMSVTDFEAQR